MIRLTGMNNKELIINCELIEKIDEVPETIITITNGNKYIVLDTPDEIIEKGNAPAYLWSRRGSRRR